MSFSLLHILKKDFRQAKAYLIAWWGLLLLKAYFISLGMDDVRHPMPEPIFYPGMSDMPTLYQLFLSYLPVFLLILIYLLPILLGYIVSLVLKADSPLDERALWRTRPVDGQKMLRAKLLFLGLFGVLVPCVIETVERLRFGFSMGECVRGFVETALIEAAWISLIASAALLFKKTFTGLLTYFAFTLVGSYMYYLLVHFELFSLTFDFDQGWNFVPTPQPGYLGIGTGFVFTVLFVLVVLVLARQMYSGARQSRGVRTLVGGLALASVVALLCRWLFFSGLNVSCPHDDSVKLALHSRPIGNSRPDQPASASITVHAVSLTGQGKTLYGSLATQSFPELKGQVLQVKSVTASLRWLDPSYRPIPDSAQNLYRWDDEPPLNTPAALAAAGYGRLAWDPQIGSVSAPLYYLNDAQFKHAQNQSAPWTGELQCESGHYVPVADILPRVGAHWQEGNLRYLFNQVVKLAPDEFAQDKHQITLLFMQYGPVDYLLAPTAPNDETLYIYLLYNPHTKECIEANATSSSNRTEPVPFFSVFYDTLQELDFDFSQKIDESGQPMSLYQMTEDDIKTWAIDAHLIVLRFEPDRRLSCTMTIDPFIVPLDDTSTAKPQ